MAPPMLIVSKLLKKSCALILLSSLAAAADLPDGPGKVTVQRVCGNCHAAQIVMSRKASKEGWERIVGDMVEKGATGTDAEFDQVIAYLAKNFPEGPAATKINVNTATAEELAATLEISGELGAAIVKYRSENGNFKSAEDLKKVPGLDAKKIDEKKDLLTF
jgi:competence protein ComEA